MAKTQLGKKIESIVQRADKLVYDFRKDIKALMSEFKDLRPNKTDDKEEKGK